MTVQSCQPIALRRRRGNHSAASVESALAPVPGVTPESLSLGRLLQRRAPTAGRCVRSSVTMCSPVRSLAVVIASTCRENAEGIVRSRSSRADTRESGPRSLAAAIASYQPRPGPRGETAAHGARIATARPPYPPPGVASRHVTSRHVTSQHCTSRPVDVLNC